MAFPGEQLPAQCSRLWSEQTTAPPETFYTWCFMLRRALRWLVYFPCPAQFHQLFPVMRLFGNTLEARAEAGFPAAN